MEKIIESLNILQEVGIDVVESRIFGKKVRSIQFRILMVLMQEPDRVFSRKEIMQRVLIDPDHKTERTIDVHIKRLREKFGNEYKNDTMIETIHGIGYRLNPNLVNKLTERLAVISNE